MRHLPATLVAGAAVLAGSAAVHAENWPQWRGPHLNGISTERGLPVTWSTTENIAWTLDMPAFSGSTPIVWGDRVFLNTADGDELQLWAVDRTKGTVLWKRALGGGNVKMRKQNMSSPSPVTDGQYFYAITDRGVLHVLDAKTGAIIYGPERLRLGTYSSSPVLADGRIYVTNEDGLTSAFKAGPTFELLAENALDDYCLSSPAVSDGQIFIRTTTKLRAIGQRARTSKQ